MLRQTEGCFFFFAKNNSYPSDLNLQVADGLPGIQRAEILSLCDEVDYLSNQLSDLCKRGLGNSPKAQEIAK